MVGAASVDGVVLAALGNGGGERKRNWPSWQLEAAAETGHFLPRSISGKILQHNLDRNLAELSSTSVLLLYAYCTHYQYFPTTGGNQPHARRYEFTTYDVLEW